MSSFLYRLGRFAYRRRRLVIAIWVLLLALSATSGVLLNKGTDDSVSIPGTSAQDALDTLENVFPQVSGSSSDVIVTMPEGATVTSQFAQNTIEQTIDEFRDLDQVDTVASPYSSTVHGAISGDERSAVISIRLTVDAAEVTDATRDAITDDAQQLQEQLGSGTEVHAGGDAFSNVVPQISIIEVIGVVLALFILFFFLRNVLAAFVPILMAITGVIITEGLIYSSTHWLTVMSTAIMLSVMIGTAVGIDYSLFIISRHRDQLADGLDPEESVARAIATSGSAVVFAGVTVAIALIGLFVAGIPFLTILGLAAALGVVIAVCIALTLLPAVLGLFGSRLRPKKKATENNKEGFFGHWVNTVTKLPVVTVIAIVAVAGILALPSTDLRLSLPKEGAQEVGTAARDTYDAISEEFGPGYNGPLLVVVNIMSNTNPVDDMNSLGDDLSTIEGVNFVAMSTPNESGTYGIVEVIPQGSPDSAETADLVQRLRDEGPAMADNYDFRDFAVTGVTAMTIDTSAKLSSALLPYGIFVVGLSLVLLVMVFNSIAVPIKATVGYLLSVLTSFGITSWVFVDGHATDLLNVTLTGSVVCFLPIIAMGVLFGLSMDYEVFLVSRTAEEYAHSGDPEKAIHEGFRKSAPVVTTAALIMIGVFMMFIPEGSAIVKPIAFALTIGVFFDAFLVRMTFVPAVLKLLGSKAWWMPASWSRVLPSFDVEGAGLARQLSMASWPGDPDVIVAARDLVVRDQSGKAVTPQVDLEVRPGQVVVLTGSEGSGKSEILLALTGRLNAVDGDLKVNDLLVPDRNSAIRSHSILTRGTTDLLPALRQPLHRDINLICIDDLDALTGQGRLADVQDTIAELIRGPRCLIVASATLDSALPALPPGIPLTEIPLSVSRNSSSPALEEAVR